MTDNLWMIASEVFLWILRSSSEHISFTVSPRNSLFHVQAVELQPSDSVKSCFTGASQTFSVRTRSSHSKTFICLKSFEIICEEYHSYWSCKMQTCKFTKKTLSHILLHVLCLHFLRTRHDYFFQRGFEGCDQNLFSRNISKRWCYL